MKLYNDFINEQRNSWNTKTNEHKEILKIVKSIEEDFQNEFSIFKNVIVRIGHHNPVNSMRTLRNGLIIRPRSYILWIKIAVDYNKTISFGDCFTFFNLIEKKIKEIGFNQIDTKGTDTLNFHFKYEFSQELIDKNKWRING